MSDIDEEELATGFGLVIETAAMLTLCLSPVIFGLIALWILGT